MMKAARLGLNPDVWGAYSQQSFIADPELRPAFVGRFENLAADSARLLTFSRLPLAELRHEIRNCPEDRRDPLGLYDEQSLAIVNELFAEDFAAFGYPMHAP